MLAASGVRYGHHIAARLSQRIKWKVENGSGKNELVMKEMGWVMWEVKERVTEFVASKRSRKRIAEFPPP